ncbi:MAG: hypothetical protein U5J82_01860 [Desulfobacterales bacterium]|nr:hypothetical protein [Desulfobacterales bacterium]
MRARETEARQTRETLMQQATAEQRAAEAEAAAARARIADDRAALDKAIATLEAKNARLGGRPVGRTDGRRVHHGRGGSGPRRSWPKPTASFASWWG